MIRNFLKRKHMVRISKISLSEVKRITVQFLVVPYATLKLPSKLELVTGKHPDLRPSLLPGSSSEPTGIY